MNSIDLLSFSIGVAATILYLLPLFFYLKEWIKDVITENIIKNSILKNCMIIFIFICGFIPLVNLVFAVKIFKYNKVHK